MSDDPWIERHARVPVVGIIAIVLIVAIVSVFLKPYVLPESPVTVASEKALAGHASASFAGMREVTLHRKEYLAATLSTTAGARTFTIDVPARLLTITENGKREEIILNMQDDALVASFEYNARQVRVEVHPTERSMTYTEPGKSALANDLVLSDIVAWQGTFTFRSTEYLFQFFPAGSRAVIKGDQTTTVPLTQAGGKYVGQWKDSTNIRPVTVDTEKGVATIEEVY